MGIAVVLSTVGLPGPTGAAVVPAAASMSNSVCAASGATSHRNFTLSRARLTTAADATGLIQRAIDDASAAGGGTVTLPAGTFPIDGHLVMENNVRLMGAGMATVLKAGPGFLDATGPDGGYPVITTAGAANATIADLTADQSGGNLNGNAHPGARFAAFLIDVRNSRNVVVEGVSTRNPFTYSIAVVGSDDFCVRHCRTLVTSSGRYTGLDGIHVLDSHTGQVIGNHVDQRVGADGDDGLVAHTINAPVYDVLYADNTVRGGNRGDGMQIAVGDHPVYDLVIRDNVFWGSPFGIRTGYWNTGPRGAVRDIAITGNEIRDLVPGEAFPLGGNAIDIGDYGAVAPVTHISINGNRICRAGIISVVRGAGNRLARNHDC